MLQYHIVKSYATITYETRLALYSIKDKVIISLISHKIEKKKKLFK